MFWLTSPLAFIFLSSLGLFFCGPSLRLCECKEIFFSFCSAAQIFRFSPQIFAFPVVLSFCAFYFEIFICSGGLQHLSSVSRACDVRGSFAESLVEHPEPRNLDNNGLKETLFVLNRERFDVSPNTRITRTTNCTKINHN